MRLAVLAAALAALALAPAARAAAGLETGLEDERILLSEPSVAPGVVAQWAALGVQSVRLHASWVDIAPAARATRRPRGFNPSDPRDRHYDWATLDQAIALVRGAGLKVALTVTGPGPVWSSRVPARHLGRYEPDPRAFAAFARAVATRYRGLIARYMVWNEPNIAGWLMPQLTCVRPRGARRRVCTPRSPHIYRALVQAAVPAIHRADPGSTVLIGELAPIGLAPHSPVSTIAPLTFYRALGCVDERYRRLTTGPCRGFKPVAADGIAHHPHPVDLAPDQPSQDPNWAKMGDLPRFEAALDRLTRMKRLRAPHGRFPLYLTEFGYQTSPPDHATGIPVARQALWLQEADYLAWRDPRVKSLTFYQWEDEPVRYRGRGSLAYAGWQSGLLYVNGQAKPALAALETPLVVDRRAGLLWGQVRGPRRQVTLERREGAAWSPFATVTTDGSGYFSQRIPVAAGEQFRASWTVTGPAPYDLPAPRLSGVVAVSGAQRLHASA